MYPININIFIHYNRITPLVIFKQLIICKMILGQYSKLWECAIIQNTHDSCTTFLSSSYFPIHIVVYIVLLLLHTHGIYETTTSTFTFICTYFFVVNCFCKFIQFKLNHRNKGITRIRREKPVFIYKGMFSLKKLTNNIL